MPWLERRGGLFRIKFRFSSKNFSVPLKTDDDREAAGILARFEENLRLLNRGRLELPDGADLGVFLLSDGKFAKKAEPKASMSVGSLFNLYQSTLTTGAKEANTLKSEGIHLGHLRRILKAATPIAQINTHGVQAYVDRRAKERYRRRHIRAVTIKKEVATLQTVWNWALRRDHIAIASPVKGITYPKEKEKPPFRTYDQIKSIVDRGGLARSEERELWTACSSTCPKSRRFWRTSRNTRRRIGCTPLVVTAAHTGARRSELLRASRGLRLREQSCVAPGEEEKPYPGHLPNRGHDADGGGGHDRVLRLRSSRRKVRILHQRERGDLGRDEPEGDPRRLAEFEMVGAPRVSRVPPLVREQSRGRRHRRARDLGADGTSTAEMRARYRHLFPAQRRAAITSLFG